MAKKIVRLVPCTCGSGEFCHKHLRYGLDLGRRPGDPTVELRVKRTDPIGRCGGGRQVIVTQSASD